MIDKRIERRSAASRDIRLAAAFYVDRGGERLARRFADSVDTAIRRVARHPAAGSPRYEELTKIAGLRSRQLRQFPYLVFYIEHPDHIEVLRVLHAERDLMAELSDADDEPEG